MYNPPDKYQKDDGTPTELWNQFHPEPIFIMLLADGQTYTDLKGCKILKFSGFSTDEDIENFFQEATKEQVQDKVVLTFGKNLDNDGLL